MTSIDWAVIPVAGRGSRMEPASSVIPKALLPVGTWPMLHWCLDEICRAGIGGVAIVVGPGQELVREYVDNLRAVAGAPSECGRLGAALGETRVRFVEQPLAAGIGDAFVRCRDITGDGAFGVLLPDNWFFADVPAIAQVAATYTRTGLCSFGLSSVAAAEAHLFGNVGGVQLEPLEDDSYRVLALQDKLPGTFPASAGGDVLRGCARYVVDGRFYDALHATGPPSQGEWDDVPAFQALLAAPGLGAHRIRGRHYDVGLPAGYLAAAAYLDRIGWATPKAARDSDG